MNARRTLAIALTLLTLSLTACGEDAETSDTSNEEPASNASNTSNGEPTSNGGASNGGTSNGGASNGGTSNGGASNGGTSNGGAPPRPAPGFGDISGDCNVLDAEIEDGSPHYFENRIDFADDPYDEADASKLTEGGREIIADDNAGGSSILSEVFAYEVLQRCESAELIATETEIEYDPQGKLADMLVEIDGAKVGIAVTRAVSWPHDSEYTVEQARELIVDKIADLQESTDNASSSFAWSRQLLHVVAYGPEHEDAVQTAVEGLNASERGDAIIFVTVSDGSDGFLY